MEGVRGRKKRGSQRGEDGGGVVPFAALLGGVGGVKEARKLTSCPATSSCDVTSCSFTHMD